MKTTTKKTTSKKVTKPTMIVNAMTCETYNDVKASFINAKVNAGMTISPEDLSFIKYHTMINTLQTFRRPVIVCECIERVEKKLPWYKRAWNWITGKK